MRSVDSFVMRRTPLSCSSLTVLVCALSIVAGCAGNGPQPSGTGSGTASGFDAIQSSIFDIHCLNACHNSATGAGNLVLEAGTSYANLVNVPAANFAASQAGLLRVAPGNLANSFLLTKLTMTAASQFGSPMPLSPPLLSAADVALIRDWILAGAPRSSVPTTPSTSTPSPTASWTPTPPVTATPSPSPIPTPTFSLASTLPQIQSTIFTATCLNPGCHGSIAPQGNLVLVDAGTSYANLVNVPASNFAASQAGLLRVVPGNPANSFLLTKLTMSVASEFGSPMPLVPPSLTAAQIDSIRAWILRGALADEAPPAP
jgi:hypothetical protein